MAFKVHYRLENMCAYHTQSKQSNQARVIRPLYTTCTQPGIEWTGIRIQLQSETRLTQLAHV